VSDSQSAVRVVVADDAAQLREILVDALGREPDLLVVGQAADGQEALDAVREHQPDVLLLDLSMPVLDGLDVLRRLREVSPQVAVVVFSGYGTPELAQTCTALGAAGYVKKGTPVAELAQVLRDAGSPQ
jgi:DNA-binding NarL/FixJ family response regulator